MSSLVHAGVDLASLLHITVVKTCPVVKLVPNPPDSGLEKKKILRN